MKKYYCQTLFFLLITTITLSFLCGCCPSSTNTTPAPAVKPSKEYLYDANGNKYELIGVSGENSENSAFYINVRYSPVFRNERCDKFYTCAEGSVTIWIRVNLVPNPHEYKMFVQPPSPTELEKQ